MDNKHTTPKINVSFLSRKQTLYSTFIRVMEKNHWFGLVITYRKLEPKRCGNLCGLPMHLVLWPEDSGIYMGLQVHTWRLVSQTVFTSFTWHCSSMRQNSLYEDAVNMNGSILTRIVKISDSNFILSFLQMFIISS